MLLKSGSTLTKQVRISIIFYSVDATKVVEENQKNWNPHIQNKFTEYFSNNRAAAQQSAQAVDELKSSAAAHTLIQTLNSLNGT
jgi:hypothetical protein